MRRSIRLVPLTVAAALFAAACSDAPSPTTIAGRSPAQSITLPPPTPLGTEIAKLVVDMYPTGLETATGTRWDGIRSKLYLGDVTTARSMYRELVAFVQRKESSVAASVDGMSAHQATVRLVLDMSLYVFTGPDTPIPAPITGQSAVGIFTPGVARTLTTPSGDAGLSVPANAVPEPIVVVITQGTQTYARCAGPLDTRLCQYPHFVAFDEFPHVTLNAVARFGICGPPVSTTDPNAPWNDDIHHAMRVAHDRPTDLSPNSFVVDNAEVLQTADVSDFIKCDSPTSVGALDAPHGIVASALWHGERALDRAGALLGRMLTPRSAYAFDQGGGGYSLSFSDFVGVNPNSHPDLRVRDASASAASAYPGDQVTLAFTVANPSSIVGGASTATSAADVPATITLRSATQPDAVLGTFAVKPALLPDGSTTFTTTWTIPATQAPGDYTLHFEVADNASVGGLPETTLANNASDVAFSVVSPLVGSWSGTLTGPAGETQPVNVLVSTVIGSTATGVFDVGYNTIPEQRNFTGQVSGSTLTFSFAPFVAADRAAVTLTVSGNTLTGVATDYYGDVSRNFQASLTRQSTVIVSSLSRTLVPQQDASVSMPASGLGIHP